MKIRFVGLVLIVALLLGCRTEITYYPATPEFSTVDSEGKIRGSVMKETSEFTIGTEGLGEYYLIRVSAQ